MPYALERRARRLSFPVIREILRLYRARRHSLFAGKEGTHGNHPGEEDPGDWRA